jgi:hypothetical protein
VRGNFYLYSVERIINQKEKKMNIVKNSIQFLSLLKAKKVRMLIESDFGQHGMKKTNENGDINPYWAIKDDLKKQSIVVARLGVKYQLWVNIRRLFEGKKANFTALPAHFDRVNKNICQNKKSGQLYLYYKQISSENQGYFLNGVKIEGEELPHLLTFKKPYYAPKRQGLKTPINVRTVKVQNILYLTYKNFWRKNKTFSFNSNENEKIQTIQNVEQWQ